jgi:hypothetical protein
MRGGTDHGAMTGRVWIEGDLIKNRSTLFGDWELPIVDIHLIGEATNDWFRVLGPTRNRQFFSPAVEAYLSQWG